MIEDAAPVKTTPNGHPGRRVDRRAFLGGAMAAAGVTVASPGIVRAASGGPLSVVATTGMIGDAVARIGGDRVTVRTLMGAGVDPHGYRQTRTDILAMARADLVVWHGLFLEAQMEAFLTDLGRKVPVVAVAEALPAGDLISHPDYPGKADPHVWMAPRLWAGVVDAVRDALIEVDPDGRDAYSAAAAQYSTEITALHGYATEVLSSVPAPSRVLVTAHDAFAYFGQAFGFEVMGVQGISTESEAGLNRIATLVEVLVSRRIPAVFVETSVSDRNMRALIEGAAVAGHRVALGGELFSDAMGPLGTYEGTYLGMMDHNVTTIARALGGDAPTRGMTGQLAAGS